jgi:hypothetical protein
VVARRATLASFLALAGCSPARLLNLTISTRDVLIERDLPYGDGPQRRLDVYRPRAAPPSPPRPSSSSTAAAGRPAPRATSCSSAKPSPAPAS